MAALRHELFWVPLLLFGECVQCTAENTALSPAVLGQSGTIADKMRREERRSRARDMHQSKIRMLEDQDEQHKGAMRTKERLEKALCFAIRRDDVAFVSKWLGSGGGRERVHRVRRE